MWRAALMLMLTVVVAPMLALAAEDTKRAWQALRAGGHIALLRHAAAPGVGDPPGFGLDDCGTQRSLSAEGRAQERRIGEVLRRRGVEVEAVYSSEWCRCLQTAELIGGVPVTPLRLLNSFFGQGSAREERQTADLRAWLAEGLACPRHAPSQYHGTHRHLPDVRRGGGGQITPRRRGQGGRAYPAALTSPALPHALQASHRRSDERRAGVADPLALERL